MLIATFNPTHLFLVALLATVVFILFRAQRKSRLAAPTNPHSTTTSPYSQVINQPGQQADWDRQMQQIAGEITSRIDSKLLALEQLTRVARHETMRLESALARSQDLAVREPAVHETVEPAHQARRLEEEARQQPKTYKPPAPRRSGEPDRPYSKIYALADTGHNQETISERMGIPIGEIELILSLRSNA